MKRTVIALIFLSFVVSTQAAESAPSADSTWNHLWRNADQRGMRLMQQGNAAAAAKVFADPRHRAHAEILSGNYEQAAHELAAFDDSEAHYNRGNALAYAGQLQAALEAYDSALKRDPDNKDARHNRELVANALKQKPPQPKNEGANKQSGDNQSKNGKNDKTDQNQQSQGADSGKQSSDPSQQGGQKGQSTPDGKKPNNPAGKNSPPDKSDTQSKPETSANLSNTGKSQNSPPAGQKTPQTAPSQSQQPANTNDAEQAKRDATASLAKSKQDPKDQAGSLVSADDLTKGNAQKASTQLTEQQLAQQQWLRSIPDDPGGLLRRKFLIEHLMRQQKSTP